MKKTNVAASFITVLVICSLVMSMFTACNPNESGSLLDQVLPYDNDEELYERPDDPKISQNEKRHIVSDGLLGSAGTAIKSGYVGALGYGYNMIDSAYYNSSELKSSHPVIDINKLSALEDTDLVYTENQLQNHLDSQVIIGKTIKEYCSNMAASASAAVQIGLTGSVKASFSVDYTSQAKSNEVFATTQCYVYAREDFIVFDSGLKKIVENLADGFENDVKDNDVSVEELVSFYGTHVLMDIYYGGRFDINYRYTNSTNKETSQIDADCQACYRYVSAEADTSIGESASELLKNSTFTVQTYGGDTLKVNPFNLESAQSSYSDWAKGIQNNTNNMNYVSLIDCKETVPLWKIIAKMNFQGAAERAAQVEKYYNDNISTIAKKFKDPLNPEPPKQEYIYKLFVGTGDSEVQAKRQLRAQGVLTKNIVDLDLNKNAGGKYVYLGYTTTTDKNQAIRGLVADYWNESKTSDLTYKGYWYRIIKVDLNLKAGGQYIYLYYCTDARLGNPLTQIIWECNDRTQVKTDGYYSVPNISDGIAMEFNKKAGGDDIYLWYKRAE